MPGITANLSNAAMAIWDEVPRKTRKSPLGGAGEPGRSKWLSSVIIEHHQGKERRQQDINEKKELMDKLRDMTASRDELQEIVAWYVRQADGPKS